MANPFNVGLDVRGVGDVRALIVAYGETVTLPGGETVKAILDDEARKVEDAMPRSVLDGFQGRGILFYVAGSDASKFGGGDIVVCRNSKWRILPKQGEQGEGESTAACIALLAEFVGGAAAGGGS